MWTYQSPNELYHHGILGMKWGVRRYQNKDGSLTPAGKKRASKMMDDYQQLTGKNLKYASMAKRKQDKAAAAKEASKKKTINDLTDDELREKVNRLQLEKNYMDLQKQMLAMNPKKVSKGKKFIDGVSSVAVPALKSASQDVLTKYLKKQLSNALGVSENTADDGMKALEKEAKYWENKKKIDQGKEYFKLKEDKEKEAKATKEEKKNK